MSRRISRRRALSLFAGFPSFLAAGCQSHHVDSIKTHGVRPLFRDCAEEAGISFKLDHANPTDVNALEAIGHGCAFLDYDGDGYLDILLVASDQPHLYHNLGDGRFEEVTLSVLPPPSANSHFIGCSVADYDGDGKPDILLTGYGTTALYHHEGGRFRDVTAGSGLESRGQYDWTTSAAWADIDKSGRLCVFIGRYVSFTPHSKQLCEFKGLNGDPVMMSCGPDTYPSLKGSLYRYEGGNRFLDITQEAGMGDSHGNVLGTMFCGYDSNGLPNLYIANDLKPADMYLNQGSGKFQNIGVISGTAYGADASVQSGMGVYWGDYDNDLRFDLLVANYAAQPKSLFHNDGHNLFSNRTYATGLGAASLRQLTFGAGFIDYDNDGLLDIIFTNGHVQSQIHLVDPTQTYRQSLQLFHNKDGSRFQDISAAAGPAFQRRIVGRGLAIGDYDNDGRLDILAVDEEGHALLLHNECENGNHWIRFRLLHRRNGPDALGTHITVTSGGKSQIAEVKAGGSYLSADAPEVHFGLNQQTIVEKITIQWQDGRISSFQNAVADKTYIVTPDDKSL